MNCIYNDCCCFSFLAVNFTLSREVCRWNRGISTIDKSIYNIYLPDNGRQHKACPSGCQFVWFLVLSLSFIHNINSKMAITVFMLKSGSYKHWKFAYVDCYLLSSDQHSQWKPISAKLQWISFLSLKESHKKYTQTEQPLNAWYLWPRSIHNVLKLQKKKGWNQKDQVLYLLRNDPVEFVVTLLFHKFFHKPLKPLTNQPVPTDAHSLLYFSPSFMAGSNYQFINPVNAFHRGFYCSLDWNCSGGEGTFLLYIPTSQFLYVSVCKTQE